MNLPEDPSNLGYDFIEDDDNERTKKFNFMTTVSIPVYDKRENAVSLMRSTEKLYDKGRDLALKLFLGQPSKKAKRFSIFRCALV